MLETYTSAWIARDPGFGYVLALAGANDLKDGFWLLIERAKWAY
jgi:hypothetical protein